MLLPSSANVVTVVILSLNRVCFLIIAPKICLDQNRRALVLSPEREWRLLGLFLAPVLSDMFA